MRFGGHSMSQRLTAFVKKSMRILPITSNNLEIRSSALKFKYVHENDLEKKEIKLTR